LIEFTEAICASCTVTPTSTLAARTNRRNMSFVCLTLCIFLDTYQSMRRFSEHLFATVDVVNLLEEGMPASFSGRSRRGF
jgi:hypothetical protein